jgi:hypothetical protein
MRKLDEEEVSSVADGPLDLVYENFPPEMTCVRVL